MAIAFTGTEYVSKANLQAERNSRKTLIAQRQKSFSQLDEKKRVESFLDDSVSPDGIKRHQVLKALQSITDPQMRDEVQTFVTKAVNSYDLTGIRFVSYYDQTAELANGETIFQDMLEANGIVRSTDFQIRWRENYANALATVAFFNLNAGLPAEAAMARAVRGNTMGAFGNQLNIRFITSELASQSSIAPTDERAEQLKMQFVRMRRFSNQKLISNTEAISEMVGDTPQWGGMLTRSVDNRTVLGAASDLTAALIQSQVAAIANATSVQGLGYHVPLICLTTAAQIAVIRSLMIARFPGENSLAYREYQAQLEAIVPGVKIPADMVRFYQPDPGRSIAFVHEPQLDSGNALFFVPGLPKLAKFQMMNSLGPWVLERPTPELTSLLVAFDFQSLIDPLTASRASYSGLN